jgi:hypothetical protein
LDPKYGTFSKLIEYWKASGSHRLILSGEAFEECEWEATSAFKELLDGMYDEVRIVMILRELTERLASSYAQRLIRRQLSGFRHVLRTSD